MVSQGDSHKNTGVLFIMWCTAAFWTTCYFCVIFLGRPMQSTLQSWSWKQGSEQSMNTRVLQKHFAFYSGSLLCLLWLVLLAAADHSCWCFREKFPWSVFYFIVETFGDLDLLWSYSYRDTYSSLLPFPIPHFLPLFFPVVSLLSSQDFQDFHLASLRHQAHKPSFPLTCQLLSCTTRPCT